MFDRTDKLVEATMLALQGKLELKENKKSNRRAKAKKAESIDVNVDETTAVSVDNGTTVVETEDATIMITEPEKQPEESIEAPADLPIETPETVEVPTDDTIMPEEILDEPVDTELPEETEPTIDDIVNDDAPLDTADEEEKEDESKKVESKDVKSINVKGLSDAWKVVKYKNKYYQLSNSEYEQFMNDPDKFLNTNMIKGYGTLNGLISAVKSDAVLEPLSFKENKKLENVEIEISDDGKEVEVTTDDHEEVEVKDETPDETEEDEEISASEDGNENIDGEEIIDDELVDECKKITESDDYGSVLYGPKYIASVTTEVAQNIDSLNNDTKYQDAIKDEDKLNLVVDSIMDDDELWNTLQETIVYYIDELIAGNLNESKKVENKANLSVKDLTKDQRIELKQNYLTQKYSKNGKSPSYGELADVDNLVTDKELDDEYANTVFCDDDFMCSMKESKKVEDTDYALEPRYSSRNSFYGKARVVTKDNGDEELYSYGTHVAGVRNGKPYTKGKFSATTSSHQNEFFKQRNIDPKKVDVEEGKTCKECDEKLEAFKVKSRAERRAKLEARRAKKTENINDDLGIKEGVPKKEDIVPNAQETTVKNGKVSSKSFTEALTKFFKENYKTIKEVNVSKISQNKSGDLKIEAVITNLSKKTKNICLEMTKIQSGKLFNKYTLKEAKGLIKESKDADKKLTMMTFTNKQNVLECRYLLKK